jgi:hypothetical protein
LAPLEPNTTSKEARLYLNTVGAAGIVVLVDCAVPWRFFNAAEFFCFLMLACITATFRLELPGFPENHSLSLLVVLAAIVNLPLPEMLIVGSVAVLVQTWWNRRADVEARRVLPLFGATAIGMVVAYTVRASSWIAGTNSIEAAALLSVMAFLLVNTGLLMGAIAIGEKRSFLEVWRSWVAGALPYYVPAVFFAALTPQFNPSINWTAALTLLAPLFVIYWSYRQVVDGWANPLVLDSRRRT